jgi:hypothetical protein
MLLAAEKAGNFLTCHETIGFSRIVLHRVLMTIITAVIAVIECNRLIRRGIFYCVASSKLVLVDWTNGGSVMQILPRLETSIGYN